MKWLTRFIEMPMRGRKPRGLVPMSDQDRRLQEELNQRNERRRAERAARKADGQRVGPAS
jgi:hypothetical protein